jgi:hypothetical protein
MKIAISPENILKKPKLKNFVKPVKTFNPQPYFTTKPLTKSISSCKSLAKRTSGK